ncbi:hypothetical protein [Corynebacterium variabile]|uniref:hypothetical protein n=1 Tax=Corynebacterium variabile TaxID=1727 RepID=UPI003F91D14B
MRNVQPRALKTREPALPEAPEWPNDPNGPAALLKAMNRGLGGAYTERKFSTEWIVDAEFDPEHNRYICRPEKLDNDALRTVDALRSRCFVEIRPDGDRMTVEFTPRPDMRPPRFR